MTNRTAKIIVVGGLLAGTAALVIAAAVSASRRAKGQSSMQLSIIPGTPTGMDVGALVPTALLEDSIGNQLVATVTNGSVYQGTTTKAPYTFSVYVYLVVGSVGILSKTNVVAFLANETKQISFPFDIPLGIGAYGAGYAFGRLYDTTNTRAPINGLPPIWVAGTPRPKPPNGKGDVNGDGFVTSDDVVQAQRIMMGLINPITGQPYTAAQIAAADANGDGVVNQGDVVSIQNYSLGLIDNLGTPIFSGVQLDFNVTPKPITPGGTITY